MKTCTIKIYALVLCFFVAQNVVAQKRVKLTKVNPNVSTKTNSVLTNNVKSSKSPNVERIKSSEYLQNVLKQGNTSNYKITSEHVSSKSGIRHVYIRQAINGIEVMGTESSLHFDRSGTAIVSHVNFVQNIESTIKNPVQSISAEQAITSVSQKMNYGSVTGLQRKSSTNQRRSGLVFNGGGVSGADIPVKKMYYYQDGIGATLAWELSIMDKKSSDWFNFIVDVSSGEILTKTNWTSSCNISGDHTHDHSNENSKSTNHNHFDNNNIIEKKSTRTNVLVGGGTYNVYEMPIESPGHGGRTIVSDPADAIASPYGWHDTDGVSGAESNYSIGNNCDAYDDRTSTVTGTGSGDNSERANGGVALDFDFTIDTNVNNNGGSINAAVTNLFYWTNIIHDVTYQYGFDEAAGNFQNNNYGNGGVGGDHVFAEAQDGSGTCNANFSTPTDGGNGRMQMYVCNTRDGDIDNGVIVHEFGHGISTRLTGGAGNSGCLTGNEQMGEGWSDFFALVMTMESGDAGNDSRGIGTWLVGQGPNGPGIRTYPYSTDLAVNPHTYADIGGEAVPHGVGSVWSMILWQMTWDLIDVYGWDADIYNGTGGNNIALAIVMEGLKLQPCGPGFVDGRDAILAADRALYNGANQEIIWGAFTDRGVGASANQGSTASNTDGAETFDLPAPEISFNSPTALATEGSDCSYVDHTVSLSIAVSPSATATTNFTIGGGTATEGEDFDLMTSSVDFTSGAYAPQFMTIRIYDDNVIEGDETITVNLAVNANGGDAVAGTSVMTFTISDDDLAPVASQSTTSTIYTEDFEGTIAWSTLNGDALANNWIQISGLTWTGITGTFYSSESDLTVLGGTGTTTPDNYAVSPQITIPNNVSLLDLTFGLAGYTTTEPYELYFVNDPSSIANVQAGTLLASGIAAAGNPASLESVSMPNSLAGQTGSLVMRHVRTDPNGSLLFFDTVNLDATVTITREVQTALTTVNDKLNISDSGTFYAADTVSDDLIMSVVNNNTFDYGCTDVSVSRAGTAAQTYNSSTGANHVMDKTFTITPTNTATSGNNDITFYFTDAEITGWETATGLSRTDLSALRTTNYETTGLTVGAFGANVTLTGNFTGLGGDFYFGHPDAFKVLVLPKVFLQGAALSPNVGEESLMRDDLRVKGLIPTTSPYVDGATCDASVFTATGNDAIVDWILIELRDATTNTTIISSKSGLLQRDGDIVEVDGTSAVQFNHPGKDYHIALKHRNHMGIMTGAVSALTSTASAVDLADATNANTFGTNAQSTFGLPTNVIGMWAGSTGTDVNLSYLGSNNDSNVIKDAVLAEPGNTSNSNLYAFDAYSDADTNMDGTIRYQGANNDVNIIKDVILSNVANTGSSPNLYIFTEQLPEN